MGYYNNSGAAFFAAGYIPGSEWVYQNGATFVGAYGNTTVTAKAAATGIKNVITEWLVSAFAAATPWGAFFFLMDGLAAPGINVRLYYQKQLTAAADNQWYPMHPANPIFMSSGNAVGVNSPGGAAGCAAEIIVKGYQVVG